MAIYDQIIQSGRNAPKPFSIYSAARNQAEDRRMARETHQTQQNLYDEQLKGSRQKRETAEEKREAQRQYPIFSQATRLPDPASSKAFLRQQMGVMAMDDDDKMALNRLLALPDDQYTRALHSLRDEAAIVAGVNPPGPQKPEDVDVVADPDSPTGYSYSKRSETPGRPAPAPRSAKGGGGGGKRADVPVGIYNNINRAIGGAFASADYAPDTGELIIKDVRERRKVLAVQERAQRIYVDNPKLTPGEAVAQAGREFGIPIPTDASAGPPDPRPGGGAVNREGFSILGFE